MKQLSKVALILLQDFCSCLTQNSLLKQKSSFVVPCYVSPELDLVHYSSTGVCLRIPPDAEIFPDLLDSFG